jgi:hypothetical protein
MHWKPKWEEREGRLGREEREELESWARLQLNSL